MNFIDIGLVSSTFGKKGTIKLDIYYEAEYLYSKYKYLILRNKDLYLSYTIKNFYKKNDYYYFSLKEINNVVEAKKLVGFDVVIPENLVKEIKDSKNELLPLDRFLGLSVYDEYGCLIGNIEDYYDFNKNIVFKIIDISNNHFYLISNNKYHVLSVDFKNKKVKVKREGLVKHNI